MFNDIWVWANANSGGLALVGLILTLATIAIAFLANHTRGVATEKILRDPESWKTLANTYRSGASDAYFKSIRRVLVLARWGYGREKISWRAYGTSLTLAYVYPLLALLFGWAAFNIWAPAGLEIFVDISARTERFLRLAIFIGGMSLAVYIIKNAEKVSDFLFAKFFGPLDNGTTRPGFLAKAGRVVFQYVAVAVAVAFAFAGAFAVAVAVAFAVAVAVAGAFAVAVAVAVAFAVAVAVAVAEDTNTARLLVLLYVMLPLLNAVADMISLGITRGFLTKLKDQKPGMLIILCQMLLDLLLAACCLAALLGSLIGALELWEMTSPQTLPLDWHQYWQDVHADPRQGVALYMMAITTLIPTVVHIIAGVGAVWTQKSRLLLPVADKLETQPTNIRFSEIEIDQMLRSIGYATLWGYGRATLVVGLVFALLLWIGFAVFVEV